MVSIYQDSLPVRPADTAGQVSVPADSGARSRQFTPEQVKEIFEALDRREQQLDSLEQSSVIRLVERPVRTARPEGFDTASVPYLTLPPASGLSENPLLPLSRKYFRARDTSKAIFAGETSGSPSESGTIQLYEHPVLSQYDDLRPGWLLPLFLLCVISIVWLKLFYHKFFNQTIQALLNYQLSSKMLRDQNMFYRRVGFVLNVNFILTGGLLVFLLFSYLSIRHPGYGPFISYLMYAGIIAGILLARYFVSHLAGHIFQKQREFREYLHEILLIYKNLGVYFLPLVFTIAYIHEDARIYLFYLSALMLLASIIIRLIKGFRILVNKDVSIFYLILYLCTLEILPLLVLYRFFSSSVLTS